MENNLKIDGIEPYYKDKAGVIYCGHTPEVLKTFLPESIDCVITSPPYWGLRDYGIEPQVWGATPAVGDGNGDCSHHWGKELSGRRRRSVNDIKDMNSKEATKPASAFNDTGGNFCSLCGSWRSSLGLEPTPELYIKHLCDIFDEIKRVLKKTGSIWVNLGDSYSGGKGRSGSRDADFQEERFKAGKSLNRNYQQLGGKGQTKPTDGKIGVPPKSLVGIPEMFVLEMQRRDWIRRNTLIWQKPNCMPSSAQDRFTVDFEYIYLFTKSNDAQFWTNEKTLQLVSKQPLGTKGIEGIDWEWKEIDNSWERPSRDEVFKTPNRIKSTYAKAKRKKVSLWAGHDCFFERQFEKLSPLTNGFGLVERGKQNYFIDRDGHNKQKESFTKSWYGEPPQGRNKRCVWRIPTQSFSDAHFATFPEKLVQDCLLPGCPEFVCPKCGKPRVKIYDINYQKSAKSWGGITYNQKEGVTGFRPKKILDKISTEIGYTDCGCGEKFEGGVCLDPFMGSGTVGVVALKLRRKFIGIEIKPEYCKMAEARIKPLMAQERLL